MKNRILTVRLEKDELVIRIGIKTLAIAAEASPVFDGSMAKVQDVELWAESIVQVLQDEEEDGTTKVHLMFDDAFQEASEQGYEGIEFSDTMDDDDGKDEI
jgi:hypothetical protein